MPQAVKFELLLYPDGTCLIFQLSNINEIEIQLSRNFSLMCDCMIRLWTINLASILLNIKSILSQFFLAAKIRLKKRAP